MSPAPVKKHQDAERRLTVWFDRATDGERLGRVYTAPVDVRLTPHDVVQPDLIFLRRERHGLYVGSVVEGAPDLVAEILFPATRVVDQVRKAALYANAGVPEYWQADPQYDDLALYVLGPTGVYDRVAPEGGVLRSTVLPDLVIEIAALFADLD